LFAQQAFVCATGVCLRNRRLFAQQAFGGLLIAQALDEDIENEAFLIDGAPEPVLFAGDGDDNLIKPDFYSSVTQLTENTG
jgi:hypothetical protein